MTLIVGGLLWLVYLAPSLRERHEARTIERNARRISATTQDLGIRSRTPMNEMSTRELVEHRRELERLARTKDRHVERAHREAVAFLVKAPAQHARAVRVNITLPEDVLAEVDKEAGRQGLSRSAFLARAARRAMNEAA
jgi:hypothetical protein